jgi:3-keto-L-gulonate-6-phosphate decarboxylase
MPQRQLAALLFVERSYVSHAEAGRMLPARRFWELADRELQANGSLVALFDRVSRPGRASEQATGEAYGETISNVSSGLAHAGLGPSSQRRTNSLLTQIKKQNENTRLSYIDSPNLMKSVHDFLRQETRRVFTLKGPAGSGKTRFVSEFSRRVTGEIYLQLHWMSSLDLINSSLADEILRYASLPSGPDALLTLEQAATGLARPFLVVLDGLSSQTQVEAVSVHLERILRQIASHRVRFLMVLRSPPNVELSQFPVLTASLYEAGRGLTRLNVSDVARAWPAAMRNSAVEFRNLPRSLRDLATVPVYLRLMVDASEVDTLTSTTTYRLIDHCVRSIVRKSLSSPAEVHQELRQLALANSADLIPSCLLQEEINTYTLHSPFCFDAALVPLVSEVTPENFTFSHEVISEYFIATNIAELIFKRGRSHAIVTAFNDLADNALTSATALDVLEFVIFALDDLSPDLLTVVALAPAASGNATLPALLTAALNGAQFASAGVIRNAANRCASGDLHDLVKVLLHLPGLADALSDDYPAWLVAVIRTYGSSAWPDVARHLAQFPEAAGTTRLLAMADLNRPDDAIFLARHYDLFGYEASYQDLGLATELRGHLDWRVRAALADTLNPTEAPTSARHIAALTQDPDYKVRAAVARVIGETGRLEHTEAVRRLLLDVNWHVRASLAHGILTNPEAQQLIAVIAEVITREQSWTNPPVHVGKLAARLLLLAGRGDIPSEAAAAILDNRAGRAALFVLLRETRSGFLTPSPDTRTRLIERGLASPDPLVATEAALAADGADSGSRREMYRRMRGGRAIQVALDLHDLDHALSVSAAIESEVDLIEVGDPLIKSAGVGAISAIKQLAPNAWIVAEMMSADWGRDQVELAAEAGADAVLLIGPATIAGVTAAVAASQRLDVPLVLDIPETQLARGWTRDMERAGVDGFTITTNIDSGVGGRNPLDLARLVRTWTLLPVAVSGGFGATDQLVAHNDDWDITIIGRGICEAVNPRDAARQFISTIHGSR